MAKQDIDIGVEGNDGTGDSIRESFRKVNENFNELYAVFGAGGQISFTNLGDTPNSLLPRNLLLVNDAATALDFVEFGSDSQIDPLLTDSVTISYDQAGKIILRTAFRQLSQDTTPTLGGPLNADGFAIANVGVSEAAAIDYNNRQPGTGVTIDDLVITKGYADARYIAGDLPIRIKDEPVDASSYILNIDSYNNGNLVVNSHGFDRTVNGSEYVFKAEDTTPGVLTNNAKYYLRFVNSNQLAVYDTEAKAKETDEAVAEAQKIYISATIAADDSHTMTDAGYDSNLEGFFLANEAVPRKHLVRRQGDSMTGALKLHDHPGDLAGLSQTAEDLQAATKYYVDNTSYSAPFNLYVSTAGDNTMTGVPPGKEGTSWTYAFSTINAAAQRAEEMIKASEAEPGPYMQTITIDEGAENATVISSGIDNPNYGQAATLIDLNREFIIREITGYLQFTYPDFDYNIKTCERDLGLILDSIATDIKKSLSTDPSQNNANSLTRKAAERYYANASGRIAITKQYTETIDAINTAKDIVASILLNRVFRQTAIGNIVIGSITKVTSATPHGLQNGNIVVFKNTTDLGTILNDNYFYVKVINANDFELFTDAELTLPVDTAAENPWLSNDGVFGTVYQTDEKQVTDTTDAAENARNGIGDKFDLVVNILTNGIDAGQAINYGKTYLIEVTNGSSTNTDQGDPTNRDVLPGKVLVGKISGAQGRIVSYTTGADSSSGNDVIEVHLLKPIDFIVNEDLEFGNFVNRSQITIMVESGQYEEDYPIKVAANVSIKGDEFRRVIIRPKNRVSQSKYANSYIYRDREFDGMTIADAGSRFYNQTGEFQGHFGYHYLSNPELPVNVGPAVVNGGGYANTARILEENKKFIQKEVINYINSNYQTLLFDHTQFQTYLEELVNDLLVDMCVNSNFNSRKRGLQFQRPGDYYADTYLRSLVKIGFNAIKADILALASFQASADAQTRITAGFNDIIDIMDNGSFDTETAADALVLTPDTPGNDNDKARLSLQANREFIAAEALAKLKELAPRKYFNETRRLHQFRLLVDALSFDLLYGGNMGTYDFTLSMFPFDVLDVEITTRENTVAAITHIRQVLLDVLENVAINSGGGNTSGNNESQSIDPARTLANNSAPGTALQELIDDIFLSAVSNNNTVVIAGQRNEPTLTNFPVPLTDARSDVQGDFNSLAQDAIADMDSAAVYTYNELKCERDVGLIVDGLIHDVVAGGDEMALETQGEYFQSYISQYNNNGFGGQELVTKGAIEYIADIADRLIDGAYDSNLILQNVNDASYVPPDFKFGTGETFSDVAITNLINKIVFAFNTNYNPPLRNDQMDCFLMNDATILRNITVQGHGGFLCTLDPEGQILTKSPYVQTGSSFSKSINAKTFSGGMFVDAYVGNLPMYIPDTIEYELGTPAVSGKENNFTLWVRSEEGQGLFIRPPELPCPFYIEGRRFQVNAISNYSKSGGFCKIFLDASSNDGNGYDENLFDERPGEISRELYLQTAGNRSMLGNDFTQINDLGYALVTNNGAFSEMVSMFTYYCHAAYYAKNGSEIRSLNGSNGYGNFGLVAEGADPNEIPDQITYEDPMTFSAKSFVFLNGANNSNIQDETSLFITDCISPPLSGSLITIDHGGTVGTLDYRVGAVTESTAATPTGGEYNNVLYRLQITGSPDGENGNFFSALQADVTQGELIQYRSADTHKLQSIRDLEDLKTRPSTAINFDESDLTTYRSISFSSSYLSDSGDSDSTYVTFDVPYEHIELPIDNDNLTGGKGSTAGDTQIAIRTDASGSQKITDDELTRLTYDLNGNQPPASLVYPNAGTRVANNIRYVAAETVAYINTTYPTLVYNEDKCYRDVTLILHGIVNDLLHDGNARTVHTARQYYEQTTVAQVPPDQLAETVDGINFARDLVINFILPGTTHTGNNNRGIVQSTAGGAAEGGTGAKVTDLMGIVTDALNTGFSAIPAPTGYAGGMIFAYGGKTHQIIRVDQDTTDIDPVDFVANRTYEITATGTTNWNDVAGTTGVTYQVGDTFTASATGLPGSGTGTAIDVSSKLLQLNPGALHDISAHYTSGIAVAMIQDKVLQAGLIDGTTGEITIKISLCRATGHDFTQIGTGSFNDSNYPNVLLGPPEDLTLAPSYDNNPNATRAQVWERRKGRVFWMSTDQFGFFRVGKFFSVDQAQGSIEFSGEIGISNANAIGFKKGVTVDEFSVDDTMGDNSENAVPTESAVVGYINKRLGRDKNGSIVSDPIGPGYLDLDGQSSMNGDLKLGTNKVINMGTPTNPADATTKAYVDALAGSSDNISALKNISENEPAGGDIFAYSGAKKLFIDLPVDSGGNGNDFEIGDVIEDTSGGIFKEGTIVDITTGIIDTIDGDPSLGYVTYEVVYEPAANSVDFNAGEVVRLKTNNAVTSTIIKGPFDEIANTRLDPGSDISFTVTRNTDTVAQNEPIADIDIQINAGAIENADVNASAGIQQSKLLLERAKVANTSTGLYGTNDDTGQSDRGSAIFDDASFATEVKLTLSGPITASAGWIIYQGVSVKGTVVTATSASAELIVRTSDTFGVGNPLLEYAEIDSNGVELAKQNLGVTVTDAEESGYIAVKDRSIELNKLATIDTDTVLGRSADGSGEVQTVSFDEIIDQGFALQDKDFDSSEITSTIVQRVRFTSEVTVADGTTITQPSTGFTGEVQGSVFSEDIVYFVNVIDPSNNNNPVTFNTGNVNLPNGDLLGSIQTATPNFSIAGGALVKTEEGVYGTVTVSTGTASDSMARRTNGGSLHASSFIVGGSSTNEVLSENGGVLSLKTPGQGIILTSVGNANTDPLVKIPGKLTVGEDATTNATWGARESESTLQTNSNDNATPTPNATFGGKGFVSAPWMYTPFIEAPFEGDSTGTGIGLGAGTGFTDAGDDVVQVITNGDVMLQITQTDVLSKGTLASEGALSSGGDFSVGLNTFTVAATNGNTLVGGTLDVTGLVNLNDTTNSTNTTSGALVVDGGLGIGLNLNVGGDLAVNGSTTLGNDPTDTLTIDALVNSSIIPTGTRDLGSGPQPWNFVYGNTFSGTATTAKYADLAENYIADKNYAPGTVLVLGGTQEVTTTTTKGDTRVAGVVTTNPAHLMNSALEGENVVGVALAGRVPVKVLGKVEKGDILVASAIAGFACVDNNAKAGAIIGKAIKSKSDADKGIIEVLVG